MFASWHCKKGRYKAIQALLPVIGATRIISLGGGGEDIGRSKYIASFVRAIAHRGSNSGNVPELLGKLLCALRCEMNDEAGISNDGDRITMNKKERRKMEKEIAKKRKEGE